MRKLFIRLIIMSFAISVIYGITAFSVFATENAMFPMEYLNISQGANDGYSHAGRVAIDICGRDTGQDAFYAPFTGTIKKTYDSDNVVWLESNEPVRFADGTVDYMTIMCMHDNDISDLYVGKVIRQGEHFLTEGMAGHADGNHIHLECGRGKFTGSGWYQNSYGKWCINNGVMPYDALFLSKSTIVINGYGYNWRYVSVDPAPSNGWIRADKSVVEVGGTVTFEYGINNATRKYLSMNKDGNYYAAHESNNTNSKTITFSEIGVYDVFVEAFNSAGAYGGSSPVRVTVISKAPSIPKNGWITANKSYIEVGDSVNFKYGIDYATTKYLSMNKNGNYWGANESNNKSEMSFTFSEVGEYDVFVEAFNSVGYGGSSPVKVMVLNKATKVPQNGWIRADKTSIPVGGQVTFEYGIDYATTKYLSMNKNGDYWGANESNKDTKKTLTFSEAGTYDVFVEAFNSKGYGGSSPVRVTVYEPTTTTATTTTATRVNGTIEVQTNISNLTQSAQCAIAVYSSDGALLGQAVNDANSSTNSITAYFPNYPNASYVKVFLWDSLKGMKPLTNGEKVNL